MESEAKPVESTAMYETEFRLPSRGKFNDGAIPGGIVRLRPITVQEEKLFSSAGNRTSVVDKVLTRCIVHPAVPILDLLITDKYFLLMCLRSISYGAEYAFVQTCPSCGIDFKHEVMLPDGLTLRMASDTDVEPFEVLLPLSKKKLSLRFLRCKDEVEIDRFVRDLPSGKAANGDPSYAYRLARHIALIDGQDVGILKALAFCETMIGQDSLTMRNAIAANETGIDFTIKVACPGCQKLIQTSLPFTEAFFPSK